MLNKFNFLTLIKFSLLESAYLLKKDTKVEQLQLFWGTRIEEQEQAKSFSVSRRQEFLRSRFCLHTLSAQV